MRYFRSEVFWNRLVKTVQKVKDWRIYLSPFWRCLTKMFKKMLIARRLATQTFQVLRDERDRVLKNCAKTRIGGQQLRVLRFSENRAFERFANIVIKMAFRHKSVYDLRQPPNLWQLVSRSTNSLAFTTGLRLREAVVGVSSGSKLFLGNKLLNLTHHSILKHIPIASQRVGHPQF